MPAITYATRSGAVRAARKECKMWLGQQFCAYEGHDYEIHADPNPLAVGYRAGDRYWYRLVGPALDGALAVCAESRS